MKKIISLFFLLFFLGMVLNEVVYAEAINLKSGKKLEGKIIEKTDEYIKLDIGIGMPITYFMDQIDTIEGEFTPSVKSTESGLIHPREGENLYFDEEYGVSLIFPDGWFIVSGKAEREQKKKELEERLSPENLAKSAQDDSGGKTCPLTVNPEAMSKFLNGMKQSMLALLPLVTAYRFDPNTTDRTSNTFIDFTIIDTTKADPLEESKFMFQFAVHFTNGRFVESPSEITVGGIRGVKATLEHQIRGFSAIESYCDFVKGDKKYSLVLMCKSEDFSKFKADFDNVINSFEIK